MIVCQCTKLAQFNVLIRLSSHLARAVKDQVAELIMMHETESTYYERIGLHFVRPDHSKRIDKIQVGDKVRLISDQHNGFAAVGKVLKINLTGVEKSVTYKTFTEVDFERRHNSSVEQGIFKVRDAWLCLLN